jgi:hypothetical protein
MGADIYQPHDQSDRDRDHKPKHERDKPEAAAGRCVCCQNRNHDRRICPALWEWLTWPHVGLSPSTRMPDGAPAATPAQPCVNETAASIDSAAAKKRQQQGAERLR